MKITIKTVAGPEEIDATSCRLVPWAKTAIHKTVFWYLTGDLYIEKDRWTVSDVDTGLRILAGQPGRTKVNTLIHAKRRLKHKGKEAFLKAQTKWRAE